MESSKEFSYQNNQGDDNADLKVFVNKVGSKWWVIVITVLLSVFIAAIYLRYSTPLYSINARLIVEDNKKGGSGLDPTAMFGDLGFLSAVSNVDNEVEILKTRLLMEQVVRSLRLHVRFFANEKFIKKEISDPPFEVNITNERDTIIFTELTLVPKNESSFHLKYENAVSLEEVERSYKYNQPFIVEGVGAIEIIKKQRVRGEYTFSISSVDKTVAGMQAALNVAVTNKNVSTIDINLQHPIPKRGEAILQAFISQYIQSNILNKGEIADSTISFIENRLLLVSRELGDIEGNIQQFKQTKGIADISEQSKLLISNSSEYVKNIADIETQINIAQALEKYLQDESRNKRVVPSSILPLDPVFEGLVIKYNSLLLERDQQLLSSTEDNPFVKNLDERIAFLRSDMLVNLSNKKKSLAISRQQLRKSSGSLEGQIRQVPAQERTYLDLARQQQIKQELYIYLLQKREETAISKTANIANSRVIDPPKSDPKPFSPKALPVLGIALILGLILPIGKIYVDELLNTKIASKKDVERYSGIPIMGELGHNFLGNNLVVTGDSRSVISEQFRVLRSNLQFFVTSQKQCVTLLMTSSMSGEGKTFATLNVGGSLAISGKKVVMLEADLRKPNLSKSLNIKPNSGITNFIIDERLYVKDILVPVESQDNLFLIPSGPIPPNPAETLMHHRMTSLIEELKRDFDYIILDAPPIGLVIDAQILQPYADLSLYLVREKFTFKDQIRIADDLYVSKKFGKMGIILNDVDMAAKGYGYSSYYGEEEVHTSLFKKIFSKKS